MLLYLSHLIVLFSTDMAMVWMIFWTGTRKNWVQSKNFLISFRISISCMLWHSWTPSFRVKNNHIIFCNLIINLHRLKLPNTFLKSIEDRLVLLISIIQLIIEIQASNRNKREKQLPSDLMKIDSQRKVPRNSIFSIIFQSREILQGLHVGEINWTLWAYFCPELALLI